MHNYHPPFVTFDPQHSTITLASITIFVAIIAVVVVVVVILFGDNLPSFPLLHHHGLQTPSPFKIGHAIWKYLYSFLLSHIATTLPKYIGDQLWRVELVSSQQQILHPRTHFFADASFTHAHFLPHILSYNYVIFQVIPCKVSYKELKKPCVRLEFETSQSQPANHSGGKPSEIKEKDASSIAGRKSQKSWNSDGEMIDGGYQPSQPKPQRGGKGGTDYRSLKLCPWYHASFYSLFPNNDAFKNRLCQNDNMKTGCCINTTYPGCATHI
ncbi:hypothetical protein M434DRAFT_39069 [Hypoxylon sp. CO27-5]|nr:hypothetical protein M434DRAFT_39069 [Hypoxylon sp. CO27-5]